MTHFSAKKPVRAKHRRIFGRLWCNYTCGTCGSRSGWRRPNGVAMWIHTHKDKSPVCYVRKED